MGALVKHKSGFERAFTSQIASDMSSGKIIIAGATGGEVAVRLEINDFIANDKFLTLYIRALSMFLPLP
jgi:hypothetical protein